MISINLWTELPNLIFYIDKVFAATYIIVTDKTEHFS